MASSSVQRPTPRRPGRRANPSGEERSACGAAEPGLAPAPAAREERRERQRPLRVVVSRRERAEIERRAASTGLSVSAYLRALGLGHEPRSVYDLEAVGTLAAVNGDLGRLGGLLKLWLAERPGAGAAAAEVETLLRQTRALQDRMLGLMGAALTARSEPRG